MITYTIIDKKPCQRSQVTRTRLPMKDYLLRWHHNISRFEGGMPKSMFGRPKVKRNKVTNVLYEEERDGVN